MYLSRADSLDALPIFSSAFTAIVQPGQISTANICISFPEGGQLLLLLGVGGGSQSLSYKLFLVSQKYQSVNGPWERLSNHA